MFQTIHGHLGQGLFLLLLLTAAVGLVCGFRGMRVPGALIRLVYSVTGFQVILGVLMIFTDGLQGMTWVHPVIGVLTVATLDIGNRLRSPMRPGFQVALVYSVAAVFAIVARAIALGSVG